MARVGEKNRNNHLIERLKGGYKLVSIKNWKKFKSMTGEYNNQNSTILAEALIQNDELKCFIVCIKNVLKLIHMLVCDTQS